MFSFKQKEKYKSSFYAYIIHYTPLKNRRKYLESKLKIEKIPHEFITNFDRENLKSKQLKVCNLNKLSLANCAINLAHIEAYRRICYSLHSYNLILEDDVLLSSSFRFRLDKSLKNLPLDYDMLFIGNGCYFHIPFLKRLLNPFQRIFLKGNQASSWGGDGATRCVDSYFMSQHCAKKIIAYVESLPLGSVGENIDLWLNQVIRKLDLKVYWLEPTLVTQGTQTGAYQSSHG